MFHADIYGPLDRGNGYTTTLLLEVVTQRNSVTEYAIEIEFYF